MCVHLEYIHLWEYSMLSLSNSVSMHVFGLTIWFWTTSRCDLPWEKHFSCSQHSLVTCRFGQSWDLVSCFPSTLAYPLVLSLFSSCLRQGLTCTKPESNANINHLCSTFPDRKFLVILRCLHSWRYCVYMTSGNFVTLLVSWNLCILLWQAAYTSTTVFLFSTYKCHGTPILPLSLLSLFFKGWVCLNSSPSLLTAYSLVLSISPSTQHVLFFGWNVSILAFVTRYNWI